MDTSRSGTKKMSGIIPSHPSSWKSANKRKNKTKTDQDHMSSNYHEMAIDERTTRDVRESSASSLSLSFISESDLVEAPSTSGCSSEMASVMHSKERKKAKAKEFMKKLKSMLPAKEKKVKMDTLSTLEQIVNNMKRLNENQKRDGEFKFPTSTRGPITVWMPTSCYSDMYISVSVKNHVVETASQSLMAHLGYPADWWKGRLLRDFLSKTDVNTVNGCLAHISKEEHESTMATPGERGLPESTSPFASNNGQGSKYFFARIRRFRKLSEGFSIQNIVSYSPFVMTVTMTRLGQDPSSSNATGTATPGHEAHSKDNPTTKDGGGGGVGGRVKQLLVVYCHPLTSAYTEMDKLPLERGFSLRHSPSCKYTDVDPSAIPLLGHLPQDFNGKSIFDLYHPDDYQKLLEIHKKIVPSMGKPFKTDSIRLRTRNGCYIELETEWSSFTNPWTTRLEFIIGQHTVIKGPSRLDVFEDVLPSTIRREAKELTADNRKTQERIMDILQKPVQDVFTQPAPRPPVKDQASAQKRSISQTDNSGDSKAKPIKEKPKVYFQAQDKGEKYTVLDEKGISSIYNQLNYSYNIKRFLLSHPKPSASNMSDEDSTPEREDSGDDPMHADEEMPLELPVVKPSSCGSSTQVHVSEQGHGEELMSPAAFDDETVGLGGVGVGQTAVVVPPKEMTADNIRVLTEESLKKHTKVQELLYLQKIAEEQPLVLNMRRIKRYQNPPQKRPWPRETDEEIEKAKHPCTNSGIFRSSSNIFMQSFPSFTSCDMVSTPPIPIPTPDQLFQQSRIVIPFTGHGVLAANQVIQQGLTSNTMTSSSPIPLVAVSPSSVGPLVPTSIQTVGQRLPQQHHHHHIHQQQQQQQPAGGMSSGIQPQNIHWPYYPQPGYTLLPQVMGGFYRPLLHPLALATPQPVGVHQGVKTGGLEVQQANTGALAPGTVQPASTKDKEQEGARSEADNMISSDTGSSIMYLLEADSSTMFEDSDSKKGPVMLPTTSATRHKNMPCAQPPWLRGVNWNNNVKMRYQMPQSRLKQVLKKDEKMAKKTQQGDLALESLEQLLEDISLPNNDEAYDEEWDFLFYPDKEEAMTDDNNRHMLEDMFMEVEMTSNLLQGSEEEEGLGEGERRHTRKGGGGDGGGGGGREGGLRQKDTDHVIWEVRELESEEQDQLDQQQRDHQSSSSSSLSAGNGGGDGGGGGRDDISGGIGVCAKEEADNTVVVSTGSPPSPTDEEDKEEKEMGALLENSSNNTGSAGSDDGKTPDAEIPAIETTEVLVPTSQVEELSKRSSSPKEGSLKSLSSSDDLGSSDMANKQETEDSQSNCSKRSSNITPSDERSNEEAGSSHKESDVSAQRLKLHSPSPSTEHCSPEDDMDEDWGDFFNKLFVPLKTRVCRNPDKPSTPSVIPFWLAETQMSQRVSMTYQIPTRVLDDVLKEDMKRMDLPAQSTTSKQQLLHLLTESTAHSKLVSSSSGNTPQVVPKSQPSGVVDIVGASTSSSSHHHHHHPPSYQEVMDNPSSSSTPFTQDDGNNGLSGCQSMDTGGGSAIATTTPQRAITDMSTSVTVGSLKDIADNDDPIRNSATTQHHQIISSQDYRRRGSTDSISKSKASLSSSSTSQQQQQQHQQQQQENLHQHTSSSSSHMITTTTKSHSSYAEERRQQQKGEGGGSSDSNSDPVVGDSIPDSSESCLSPSGNVSTPADLGKHSSPSSSSSPQSATNPTMAEKGDDIDSFFYEMFSGLDSEATPGMSIEDVIMSKVFVSDTGTFTRAMKNILGMPE